MSDMEGFNVSISCLNQSGSWGRLNAIDGLCRLAKALRPLCITQDHLRIINITLPLRCDLHASENASTVVMLKKSEKGV